MKIGGKITKEYINEEIIKIEKFGEHGVGSR